MDTATRVGGDIPRLDFDPFSLDAIKHRHEYQDRAREFAPVMWIEEYQTYGVGRFEEVHEVLRRPNEFCSAGGAGMADIRKPGSWREAGPIVDTDPPRHTGIRSTMNKIISPKVVKGWRETFEREAEALCDQVLSSNTFDAVNALTEAFVLKVFPDALGLECNRDNLLIIGNHNFNSIGPANSLFYETEAKIKSIAEWLQKAQQQENLIPGGFGELIFEAEKKGDLPEGVAAPMMKTMMRGGTDTTIAGLGNAFWLLANHPEQYAMLRENPSLVRFAFEEALRVETPIQTFFRTTVGHVQLAGVTLEPDTKIQMFVGGANRDPRRWEDPNRFDLKRMVIGHLALGGGIHVCLGQQIARMEAECLLGAFVKRVAKVEMDGDMEFRMSNALRTPNSLPLKITRA